MIKAIFFDFYGVLESQALPNQQLLDYIKTDLKSKYKLGIISNAADDYMYEIIPRNELEAIFDVISVSYIVGFAKPDERIYEFTADKAGIKPSEAIFIDDIMDFCKAAEDVGMQAILYRDFSQTKAELEKLLTDPNN